MKHSLVVRIGVIECIFAAGEKVPPYVIFKGENLMTNWPPETLPRGWMFACNSSGWTNNYHGMTWIKHFELTTTNKLQSSEEHRLLLCDSHDIHISADFVSFCIQNRVALVPLPHTLIPSLATSRCRGICTLETGNFNSNISAY